MEIRIDISQKINGVKISINMLLAPLRLSLSLKWTHLELLKILQSPELIWRPSSKILQRSQESTWNQLRRMKVKIHDQSAYHVVHCSTNSLQALIYNSSTNTDVHLGSLNDFIVNLIANIMRDGALAHHTHS